MNIQIGADPELFIQNGRHILSAHTLPAGTKKKPLETDHGSIQVDGTALEFNVRPAETEEDFLKNTKDVMGDMSSFLKAFYPKARLIARPTVYFGRRKLSTMPDYAVALGCERDYNAYTKAPNRAPNSNTPFRTGSGHVHISWTKDASLTDKKHFEQCCRIVTELDYYLGLPSLLWDKDQKRRLLYGRAGAFRPKPYGLEYRVLSNKWLETDGQIRWIFRRAKYATEKALARQSWLTTAYQDLAQRYINNSDTTWETKFPAIAHEVLK